ncbi:MAG: glycosyl transferase [Cyanobacteria bacterium J06631_12]
MPTLYIAVTNHGFGHATRAASIAAEIRRQCEVAGVSLTLVMATKAPKWLLDCYLKGDYIHRLVRFDVGVLQRDSLTMDRQATLTALRKIQAQEESLIAEETAFMTSAGVDLVLSDVPPLMGKIARRAEVPCWMISNFGWDFIYRPWQAEIAGFGAIADWIAECYRQCDRTFRLPFHEPMASFSNVTDVGLTGGVPAYSEAHLRQLMDSDVPTERTVLLTFGGLGLTDIPYQTLADFSDWQFVTFDSAAPNLPNLYRVSDRAMRPVDWMLVCDRVFSKPGYSTFAEACLLDKGLITITREGFAEAEILIAGAQDYAHHRIVEAETFFQGDWSCLTETLLPPRRAESLDKTGKETIAAAVVDRLSSKLG